MIEEGKDVGARLWETTGESICVGVWDGVDERVREVGVGTGEDIGVGAGLRPDSGEAEGGVFEALALGLCGLGGEEDSKDAGGEEDVKDDLGV